MHLLTQTSFNLLISGDCIIKQLIILFSKFMLEAENVVV